MEKILLKMTTKDNQQIFEVCKEGILVLRSLSNRKLRIIFNVIQQKQTSYSLQQFNSILLKQPLSQNSSVINGSYLTIHEQFLQLSDERTVVIFNAYQNIQYPPFFSIIGYLAASLFMYHQVGQLSYESPLTSLLSRFKQSVAKTNIDLLDQQIKYKTGYDKKPYFLCLINDFQYSDAGYSFKQFYASKQNNKALNNAIDTLLYYFPERTAICLNQKQKSIIQKIGEQFIKDIVGRQIFNFQFTGITMQNLCFQLCQAFNQKSKINLLEIYEKIIMNQKLRVENQSLERFYDGIDKIKKMLPMEPQQFVSQFYLFSNEITYKSMNNSINSMEFSEYIKVYQKLQDKMQKQFKNLSQQNLEKCNQLNIQIYQVLQNLEVENQNFPLNKQTINELFQLWQNKLQLFTTQSIGYLKDNYIIRLGQKHANDINGILQKKISQLNLNDRTNSLKIKQLNYQIQLLKQQNKTITQQYELQLEVINQYKLKLHHPDHKGQDGSQFNKEIINLKKKIQQYQEKQHKYSAEIQQLYFILNSFEGVIEKNKGKSKYSKNISDIIKEVSDLAKSMYTLLDEVNRTEQRQIQLKKKFQQTKKKKISQWTEVYTKLARIQAELDKQKQEKEELQKIIKETKMTINIMKEAENKEKQTLNQLQKRCGRYTCLLADTQGQLQTYQKAVKLMGQHITKGKSQNLHKWIKVLKNEDLKEYLKTIVKK